MRIVAEWTVEDRGWVAEFRLIERRTWLWPVRLEGRWYRGPFAELQTMRADEHPSTGWIPIARSLDVDALLPNHRSPEIAVNTRSAIAV